MNPRFMSSTSRPSAYGNPRQNSDKPYVVGVGGVGGSGTRLGAALLQTLGYYIGDDLNESLDNQWFTLLFKRRSVLLDHADEFHSIVALFYDRMMGKTDFTEAQRQHVREMAYDGRLQHPHEWLLDRVGSFLGGVRGREADQPWGWKEPNTHIVIDRLLALDNNLRYLHFARHPIDMALSLNQNQLEIWGPIILDRDVALEPGESLTCWCAAHRRFEAVMRRWPERVKLVRFEEFCADPVSYACLIANFIGAAVPANLAAELDRIIERGRASSRRFSAGDLKRFAAADLEYVRGLGYPM